MSEWLDRKAKVVPPALQRVGIRTPEEFSERLIAFRRAGPFSIQDMATYIGGISMSTIRNWEKGRCMPDNKVVINRLIICRIIG